MSGSVFSIQRRESMNLIQNHRKQLESMMVATKAIAREKRVSISENTTLTEVTEFDEFILTELCKEVSRTFGDHVSDGERESMMGRDSTLMSGGDLPDFGGGARRQDDSMVGLDGLDGFLENPPEDSLREQQSLMNFFESQKQLEVEETIRQETAQMEQILESHREEQEALRSVGDDSYDKDRIEVAPGISLPLARSDATFEGLLRGDITTVLCYDCQQLLTVAKGSYMVVCGDCWICMPTEEFADREIDPSKDTVSLGVKDADIAEWWSKQDF